MKKWFYLFLFALPGLLVSAATAEQAVSAKETEAIAKDAYIYAYAMMESYQTWRTQAVDKAAIAITNYVNPF